jgi:hypothetical protein
MHREPSPLVTLPFDLYYQLFFTTLGTKTVRSRSRSKISENKQIWTSLHKPGSQKAQKDAKKRRGQNMVPPQIFTKGSGEGGFPMIKAQSSRRDPSIDALDTNHRRLSQPSCCPCAEPRTQRGPLLNKVCACLLHSRCMNAQPALRIFTTSLCQYLRP